MRKGSTATICIIGAILIALTLGVFFLLVSPREALHWWALSFLLLAEIAACAGFVAVRARAGHNGVFAGAGITALLGLYFAATLVSSLCAPLFRENLNAFIALELGIIALSAIILLLVAAFSRRVAASDRRTLDARAPMDDCERRIRALLVDDRNREYRRELDALCEDLRYSDKIGVTSVDDGIGARISALESALGGDESRAEDVHGLLGEISALIRQRKDEMGEKKRGGF